MGPLDLVFHLLGFAAPAVSVAVMVALAARVLAPGKGQSLSWWAQTAISSIAGSVVLVAGLWYFGADGKMDTYLALVLAVASCEWLCSRAGRAERG
ncbi:MAG: hypothetical protein ABIU58_00050 [Ramlibacter sp.]